MTSAEHGKQRQALNTFPQVKREMRRAPQVTIVPIKVKGSQVLILSARQGGRLRRELAAFVAIIRGWGNPSVRDLSGRGQDGATEISAALADAIARVRAELAIQRLDRA